MESIEGRKWEEEREREEKIGSTREKEKRGIGGEIEENQKAEHTREGGGKGKS